MARNKAEAGFTVVEVVVVAASLAFIMAAVLGIYQVTQRSTLFATAGEDAQLTARAVLNRLTADFQLVNAGRAYPVTLGAITAASATSITFLGDVDNTLDANGNFITLNAQANAGDTTLPVTAPASGTDLTKLFPCGSSVTIADGPVMESHPLKATGCVSGNTLTLAESLLTWYPSGSLIRSVETVSYAWELATGNLCRSVNAACPTPAAKAPSAFTDAQTLATGVTNFQLTYLDSNGNSTNTLDAIRAAQVVINVSTQSGDQSVTRNMEVTARPRNL